MREVIPEPWPQTFNAQFLGPTRATVIWRAEHLALRTAGKACKAWNQSYQVTLRRIAVSTSTGNRCRKRGIMHSTKHRPLTNATVCNNTKEDTAR